MKKTSHQPFFITAFIFCLIFTSCATTKYQELGFGGGNGSFATKKSVSTYIESDTFNTSIQFSNRVTEEITKTADVCNLSTEIFKPVTLNKKHAYNLTLFNPKIKKVNQSKFIHNLIKKINPYINIDKNSSGKKWLLFILSMVTLGVGSCLFFLSLMIMGYGYDVNGGAITVMVSILLILLGIILMRLTKKTP